MAGGGTVERRLSWYWQLELANAAFVPAFFLIMGYQFGAPLGWPTMVALVPVIGLLIVGGLYWRGKLRALQGERAALDVALRLADRWDRPLLVMTVAALGLALAGLVTVLPGAGTGDRWAATGAALLALAEYVNYYHRQLQHFDNWSDFRRLISGKGFRQAKMAADLAAWRKARSGG